MGDDPAIVRGGGGKSHYGGCLGVLVCVRTTAALAEQSPVCESVLAFWRGSSMIPGRWESVSGGGRGPPNPRQQI